MEAADYVSPSAENCDLMAENNAFFKIDFYIIETLYIPVTIVNSDHAVEASMLQKIKHSETYGFLKKYFNEQFQMTVLSR